MSSRLSCKLFACVACATLLAGAQAQTSVQDTLPKRRAGLWEHTMEMQHLPGQQVKSQQCVDASTDLTGLRRVLAGDERNACSERSARSIGGAMEYDMACNGPDGSYQAITRLAGDMSSSYRVESQISYLGNRPKLRETRMVVRASYVGPCPASVRPGERRVLVQPGGEIDEARLEAMTPHERRRALQAAGKAETH